MRDPNPILPERSDERASATSRLLRDLLLTDRRYRLQWQMHSLRTADRDVSVAAVARVLTLHLWDAGMRDESDRQLARRIRDRVRRALRGSGISVETLTWFVGAFGMSPMDEQRLMAVFNGTGENQASVERSASDLPTPIRAQRHHTFALFDRYRTNPSGALRDRWTSQAIMAVEDGVDEYVFEHDDQVASVRVYHGATLVEPAHRYGPGLIGHVLRLPAPLRRGQVAMLEYRVTYRTIPGVRTEVRRIVRNRAENLQFSLRFDQPPQSVCWCVWSDPHTRAPLEQLPLVPNGSGSVQRFLAYSEYSVVGFRWQAPP